MGFLTPLFLIGGLAVALPIVFHLIRRTTRDRTTFSSLLFLSPTPPRLTRRSRLEHLLLLALRASLLCLLALAFARPYLKNFLPAATPAASSGRTLVLLDTSASMRRPGLWEEAKEKAASIFRKAGAADQVALFTFDRQAVSRFSFEDWARLPLNDRVPMSLSRLNEISPGWGGTSLGSALIQAAEALSDKGDKGALLAGRIELITDFQEGSHPESLQGYEWPKGVRVDLIPVRIPKAGNASMQYAAATDAEKPGSGSETRIRVLNSADSRSEKFQIGWVSAQADGFLGRPQEVYVPAGQSRSVLLASPGGGAASRILLKGDETAFDDFLYVIPPQKVLTTLAYFGQEPAVDSRQMLFFLERACQETRQRSVRLRQFKPGDNVTAEDLKSITLPVVTDAIPAPLIESLRQACVLGKTVLVALRNESTADTLARLIGAPSLEVREVEASNYTLLAEIDFQHPVFRPFADPRFSDFTKVHFWRYRKIQPAQLPGSRILARFDGGDPALIEIPLGKGGVYVLTSGWHPEDSQLALSTRFIPLLYSLLDIAGQVPPSPLSYAIGDPLPLSPGAAGVSRRMVLPSGEAVNLSADATQFTQTAMPGIYREEAGAERKEFAVNLEPSESRTGPLPVDELEKLGVPVVAPAVPDEIMMKRQLHAQRSELESQQKIWRWLVLACVALLLAETWLGGRTARLRPQPAS